MLATVVVTLGAVKFVVEVVPVFAEASMLMGVVVFTPEKDEMPPALPAEALNVQV